MTPAQSFDPDSFGFLVTDLARLMRAEMDRRIAAAGLGLTPGDVRTLFHIARGGSLRQAALADSIGVEAMTVSASLDRLEGQGLVERLADPGDRRAKLVRLTAAARDVLARVAPVSAAVRTEAAHGIAQPDWDRLLERLRTVRANLVALKADAGRGTDAA